MPNILCVGAKVHRVEREERGLEEGPQEDGVRRRENRAVRHGGSRWRKKGKRVARWRMKLKYLTLEKCW